MNYTRNKNKITNEEGITQTFKSINEAKRESRKLQLAGNKVKLHSSEERINGRTSRG